MSSPHKCQPIKENALQLELNKGTFIIQLGICHHATKEGKNTDAERERESNKGRMEETPNRRMGGKTEKGSRAGKGGGEEQRQHAV